MTDFFERNLEGMIFQNRRTIPERGLPIWGNRLLRQVPLPSGRKIDLFAFEISAKDIDCTIYELKKGVLDIKSIAQILDYSSEISMLLQPHFNIVNVRNILVGNDYSKEFFQFYEHLHSVDAYLYHYNIDGIRFKQTKRIYEVDSPELTEIFYTPSKNSMRFLNTILESKLK